MWEVKKKSDLNSSTFDLLLTYNLCHVNPCSGMSQCQVGFTDKGYRCVCQEGKEDQSYGGI